MKNRILVIQLPEFPFTIEQLLPSLELAELAARLKAANPEISILDFANLNSFIQLNPDSLRPESQEWAEDLFTDSPLILDHIELTSAPESIQEQWRNFCRSCFSTISKHTDLKTIVFRASGPSSYEGAAYISEEIRKTRPSISTCAWGPFFARQSAHIPEATQRFDCVIMDNSQSGILEWIDLRSCPKETWQAVPNAAYQDGTRLNLTTVKTDFLPAIAADYSPDVYQGIDQNSKINLFTIRELSNRVEGQTETSDIKKPSFVIDEIRSLQDTFGAQCFHISGADKDIPHPKSLAYEFLKRKLNIRYTRESHIKTTGTAAVTAMNASGCHSLSLFVPTGSQRLLEDLYHCDFTITQAEQAVRTCKFSNIHTIINMAYPGTQDDYHTEAESLRLLERARPSSVFFPAKSESKETDRTYRKRSENKKSQESQFVSMLKDNNISIGLSPQINLLLDLVGQKGNEIQFMEEASFQFLSGDVEAVMQLVETMNRAACRTPNVLHFKPFQVYQHVVGN